MNLPNLFLSIDEEGIVCDGEQHISNPLKGHKILEGLFFLENNSFASHFEDNQYIIEAFDAPLVVQTLEKIGPSLNLHMPYGYQIEVAVDRLLVDEWDRFHGETPGGVPFVFSRKAQKQFFEILSDFDDDSFDWNGQKILTHPFWQNQIELNGPDWWNKVYTGENTQAQSGTSSTPNPRWNLEEPSVSLKDMLPRLKLPKSKVLILGTGDSHDAALFAEQGHVVTAVDISHHALERSQKLYGHLKNINWLQADLFKLPESLYGKFDIVYEYTCFCAINPTQRNELIRVWKQCLHEQGQLLGTFFCMHKRQGPPFGASEWELRKRLEKSFQFLFWGRWKNSLPRRQGRELFVLARRK